MLSPAEMGCCVIGLLDYDSKLLVLTSVSRAMTSSVTFYGFPPSSPLLHVHSSLCPCIEFWNTYIKAQIFECLASVSLSLSLNLHPAMKTSAQTTRQQMTAAYSIKVLRARRRPCPRSPSLLVCSLLSNRFCH